jgi:2-oxoisovalerate dehydrogenase E1 component alpha subunit
VTRLRQYLTGRGLLDETAIAAIDAEAEEQARALRERMAADPSGDPAELFRHVYAEPTAALRHQQDELTRELAGDGRDR